MIVHSTTAALDMCHQIHLQFRNSLITLRVEKRKFPGHDSRLMHELVYSGGSRYGTLPKLHETVKVTKVHSFGAHYAASEVFEPQPTVEMKKKRCMHTHYRRCPLLLKRKKSEACLTRIRVCVSGCLCVRNTYPRDQTRWCCGRCHTLIIAVHELNPNPNDITPTRLSAVCW